jgi:hypothetical protein
MKSRSQQACPSAIIVLCAVATSHVIVRSNRTGFEKTNGRLADLALPDLHVEIARRLF